MPGLSVLHSSFNARYRFIPNALPFRPFPSGYASLHPNAPTRQRTKCQPFHLGSRLTTPGPIPAHHLRRTRESGSEVQSLPMSQPIWFICFIISIIHNILKHHQVSSFSTSGPWRTRGLRCNDRQTDVSRPAHKVADQCLMFSSSLKDLHQCLTGTSCCQETFEKTTNPRPWNRFLLLWVQLICNILLVDNRGAGAARSARLQNHHGELLISSFAGPLNQPRMDSGNVLHAHRVSGDLQYQSENLEHPTLAGPLGWTNVVRVKDFFVRSFILLCGEWSGHLSRDLRQITKRSA